MFFSDYGALRLWRRSRFAPRCESTVVRINLTLLLAIQACGARQNRLRIHVLAMLKQAMQRPLILGASVSGDYLTASPGRRLALRFTKPESIRVIARKGTPGREIMKHVSDSVVSDRTSIICVDTFFWDSLAANSDAGVRSIERLVDFAKAKDIPLVLAEVPEVLPWLQKSAAALNRKIVETAASYAKCLVLPLNTILRETLERGHIVQNGKRYGLEMLVPDGLHIAEPASEYLADRIAALF